MSPCQRPLALLVHPSSDLYGSDRQLVETAIGLVQSGWDVRVLLPGEGPLVERLRTVGARVAIDHSIPVLRRSLMSPMRLPPFAARSLTATGRQVNLLRSLRPDVLVVSTVVLPTWLVAGRTVGVPVVAHVHEDENRTGKVARALLLAPLLAADGILANSRTTRDALTRAIPRLSSRAVVVENGVRGPERVPTPVSRRSDQPLRVVQIGRLSAVKGTDVALEAVASVRTQGHDVRLTLCGDIFPGNESFLDDLRRRASHEDLAGAVTFAGAVPEPWPWLAEAHVALVPSRMESFGNSAVEAMLARRPVIASHVQGLGTVVEHGRTGVTVPPGDATALADAIHRIGDSPLAAAALAERAFVEATTRFAPATYRRRVVDVITACVVRRDTRRR